MKRHLPPGNAASYRKETLWPAGSSRDVPPDLDTLEAASYQSYAVPADGSSQLEETLDLLYRGKWIILLSLLLFAGAGYVYNRQVVPEYESSALVLVQPRTSSSMNDAMAFSSGGLFARNDRSLANEVAILRNSLAIARNVAVRLLDMHDVPGTTRELPILGGVEDWTPRPEDVAMRLGGRIQITQERDVDVIRLTAASTDPVEATTIANVYAEEYIRQTREASRARIQASRAFLERQEELRKSELAQIEDRIQKYMSSQGAIALDSEGQRVVDQISSLEAARDDARIELQMRRASLTLLEEELNKIHPQLAQRVASGVEGDIKLAQQKLADLEVTRQQSLLRNPSLQQADPDGQLTDLNKQITQLRTKIDRLARQYVDEVLAVGGIDLSVEGEGLARVADLNRQAVSERIAISGIEAKLDVMDQRIKEYDDELVALPQQVMQLAQMQRERASAERMFSNVVEKLQEARIAEESELGYADLIREAIVPRDPVRPDRRRNMLLATFLGLGLGLAIAAARRRLDNRVYAPEDLRGLGISVLGIIPDMQRIVRDEYKGQEQVEMDGHTLSTRLVTLLNPMSHVAEAYRHLRTNIQFSRPDAVVSTILVTSGSPQEGKSVTAANLAVVMAQAGRRTLIIDADLRRPRVHQQLGVAREPGLVDLLFTDLPQNGYADLDVDQFATGIDDLYVLSSGRLVPNPAELLGSKRMRDLIDALRKRFDVIVFDSPPVFAATDAVLLSTQCDATMLVVTAKETRRPSVEHANEVLLGVGANIIGAVLNRFEAIRGYGSRYGYYGHYYRSKYGYAYGYGYGDHAAHRQRPSRGKRSTNEKQARS